MLGSVEPLRLRATDFEWKLDVPRRKEMLDLLGIHPDRRSTMVECFPSLPRDRQQVDLTGVKGDVRRHLP